MCNHTLVLFKINYTVYWSQLTSFQLNIVNCVVVYILNNYQNKMY